MVKIPTEVKQFLKRVRKRFIPENVYLFGSRATGRAKKQSDWDFIIVSKNFQKLSGYKRAVEIHKLSTGDFALDVLCFTPGEFENKKKEPSIIRQAIRQKALVQLEI